MLLVVLSFGGAGVRLTGFLFSQQFLLRTHFWKVEEKPASQMSASRSFPSFLPWNKCTGFMSLWSGMDYLATLEQEEDFAPLATKVRRTETDRTGLCV